MIQMRQPIHCVRALLALTSVGPLLPCFSFLLKPKDANVKLVGEKINRVAFPQDMNAAGILQCFQAELHARYESDAENADGDREKVLWAETCAKPKPKGTNVPQDYNGKLEGVKGEHVALAWQMTNGSFQYCDLDDEPMNNTPASDAHLVVVYLDKHTDNRSIPVAKLDGMVEGNFCSIRYTPERSGQKMRRRCRGKVNMIKTEKLIKETKKQNGTFPQPTAAHAALENQNPIKAIQAINQAQKIKKQKQSSFEDYVRAYIHGQITKQEKQEARREKKERIKREKFWEKFWDDFLKREEEKEKEMKPESNATLDKMMEETLEEQVCSVLEVQNENTATANTTENAEIDVEEIVSETIVLIVSESTEAVNDEKEKLKVEQDLLKEFLP